MLKSDLYNFFRDNALLWGMNYMPHYFRIKSPLFHLKILKESNDNLYLAVQAPRGSAKSSILTFLRTIHAIAHKEERFVVLVQNTFAKAAASLESIKSEFKDNEALMKDYPITFVKDAEGDSIFKHKDGFTTRVLCKGADQLGSVRGEKHGAFRPSLIIIDDLEDDKMVKNPDLRKELETVVNEVLKYAGDQGTRIIVVGTILHDDSQMAKFLSKDRYRNYKKLFFRALNKVDGVDTSLWPEKWSVEDLKRMEDDDPSGFAKEMQGDPSSGKSESFERKNFRYWREEGNQVILLDEDSKVKARYDFRDCSAAIACDLAWEEKKSADESVLFPAFITPNREILFDTYLNKRGMRPEELEESLFAKVDRLETLTKRRVPIGFEKAKLEKVIKHLLQEAQRRRNKWLWFKDLAWDGDKIQRILTRLSNRYSQHVIYHKRGMGELENQLIRLTSVAHDDIADAAQGVVQLLQYAPTKKPQAPQDDAFKQLQALARKKHNPPKDKYIFGTKNKISPIKAMISIK